jgi:hypothetical protein
MITHQGRLSMGNVLTTFVKKECCNWDSDTCLGATLLSTGLFNTTGKCYILEGKSCPYFERCVLPSAKNDSSYDKIVRYYSKINSKFDPAYANTCNDCGKTIPPRKRYCKKCAKKRRNKTYKISSKNYRSAHQHLNIFVLLQILTMSGFMRCDFLSFWGKTIITPISYFLRIKC